MTREETIDILNQEKKHHEVHLNNNWKSEEYYKEMKIVESYDMAIDALEAWENVKADTKDVTTSPVHDNREPVADILKNEIAKVSHELNRIVNELHALNRKK